MLRIAEPQITEFTELKAYCSGFQSPADDYAEPRLDIRDRLIKDPVNTYFLETDTDEMEFFGITKGNILVVDRSVEPQDNCW